MPDPYGDGYGVPLCPVKLHRCCGEGPLMCTKPVGHVGPHEDDGVCWG